jgi:hypothetical protein
LLGPADAVGGETNLDAHRLPPPQKDGALTRDARSLVKALLNVVCLPKHPVMLVFGGGTVFDLKRQL